MIYKLAPTSTGQWLQMNIDIGTLIMACFDLYLLKALSDSWNHFLKMKNKSEDSQT